MTAPLVTVLMPVKDTREDWLKIAISGIANQSYPNLDLRIGDDGSTKASSLAVLKWAQETFPERVFVHRRPESGGTAHALDEALNHADSETLYFSKADSDDLFFAGLKDCKCLGRGKHDHPGREEQRVKLFEDLPPQVGIVYDNYTQLIYEPRPTLVPVVLRPYDYRALLEHSYIPGNSMWRASVYEKIPKSFVYDGYDGKANRHGEDYALWLAITDFLDGFWLDGDPAFTWTYRVYGASKYMKDRKGVDYARALLQYRARERRGLA